MTITHGEFEHSIKIIPAYDTPKHGIHGADLWIKCIKGNQGVTLSIFTHWMLPHIQDRLNGHLDEGYKKYTEVPSGSFISYHSSTPQYEGQTASLECNITGGICYSDGSGLLAEEFLTTLIAEGSKGLEKKMEEQYAIWLESENTD